MLDAALDKAWECSGGKKSDKNDAERVACLFELYQQHTRLLPAEKAKAKPRRQMVQMPERLSQKPPIRVRMQPNLGLKVKCTP